MTKDTMLGRIMQLITELPLERLGVVRSLVENLGCKEWKLWLDECKKFLKKKPCWTGIVEPISEFLKLLSGDHNLTLDALDGKEVLANANDVFTYIDSDFKNWGADELGEATEETDIDVYELAKDSMFADFFGSVCSDVSKICFTHAQVKNFCVKHRDWLRKDGYATFFLFKWRGELFVALVFVYSGGRLSAHVRRFRGDNVWIAESRRRMVIPQLA